jgi:demethoxyubiquinone hydroxylase (CLK1/Coq7/Cat5 family)
MTTEELISQERALDQEIDHLLALQRYQDVGYSVHCLDQNLQAVNRELTRRAVRPSLIARIFSHIEGI